MAHAGRKRKTRTLYGRQAELLGLIQQSITDRGRPPTMKELSHRMRTGHARIYPNVRRLIELGYLKPAEPVGTLRVRMP